MISDEELKNFGFEPEKDEENRKAPKIATGYPKPLNRYRLYVEGYNISIEEPYFWVLHYLRYYNGFPYIDKITDVFAAAENSSFFGTSQQRLGSQQDKVSQYLATVGKMVKELFQLVRELRVLDERLSYYVDSFKVDSPSRESAEITLKGIWVDMVEQGAKNPASVYGMAREVQFTTLPDLFFSTHPAKQQDVDLYVEKHRSEFNRKVREVLKRKLRTFLSWKEHTFEEIKTRRQFTLKYLRQHYEIIRMYMAWVKPYLKNVQRLQMDQTKMDTADLLVAFETSLIEVEILARMPMKEGGYTPVILIHFWFRTRPEMSYQQEGWQKGPLHVGRVEMNWRAYSWNQKDIDNYKEMKREEEFKLLGMIDVSVKAAMEALGDELMDYLVEAGEEDVKRKPNPKKESKDEKPVSKGVPLLKPFISINNLFRPYSAKVVKEKPKSRQDAYVAELGKSEAAKKAKDNMWSTYHHFKKHHAMLNW
ncbi:MAG: hypothetical protein ABIJ08_03515 [Nanoarchaeota archaeon]